MDYAETPAIERLWVVFFRDSGKRTWWDVFTHKGFRHVSAAAWYGEAKTWVFYDPAFRATAIVLPGDGVEANAWFGAWVAESRAILRVKSTQERIAMPALFSCVGAIKALLGVRSRALCPRSLFRDLLARGAEIVEVPERSETIGEPFRDTGHPAVSAA